MTGPSWCASLAASATANTVQNRNLCVWLCPWALSCLLQERLHPSRQHFWFGQIFVRQNATTCLSRWQGHSSADGVSVLLPQPSGTCFHHSTTRDHPTLQIRSYPHLRFGHIHTSDSVIYSDVAHVISLHIIISRGKFRAGLKTHLFTQAYGHLWERLLILKSVLFYIYICIYMCSVQQLA